MNKINNLFKTNFVMESHNDNKIYIPINAKVTVIKGNSATGKTKMINEIDDLTSNNGMDVKSSTVDLKQILIVKDLKGFEGLLNFNKEYRDNKIIFIDKFDLTDFKVSIPFIKNCNSFFVLCAYRSLPKCGWEYDSLMTLEHDGKNYTLKPIPFSFKEWLKNK